jgi:2-iminobutanoate/2-iminopropanoate deaminase
MAQAEPSPSAKVAGAARTPPSWPPTRSVGDLIFISGQIAIDDDGALVGGSDWGAQALHCLRRIERELDAQGATMRDVVRLTCFLVDAAVFPFYAEARREHYPDLHAAGTSVIVSGLLVEGAMLEVEATAMRSNRATNPSVVEQGRTR